MSDGRLRAQWPLLKATISKIEGGKIVIHLGGTTTITVPLNDMHLYDIKEGDIVTLYTEVFFAKPQG